MAHNRFKKTNNQTATFGENSESVLALQKSLNEKGANLKLDSRFGPLTQAAQDKFGVSPVDAANTTQQGNRELADDLAQQGASPAQGVTSSSKGIRNDESKIKETLTQTSIGEAGLRDAFALDIQSIDDRIAQLSSDSSSEISSINQGFDAEKKRVQMVQEEEVGQQTTQLARLGGFLGPSASGNAVLINLGNDHKNELIDLQGRRQTALTDARNLQNERRFDLVKLKIDEIKGIEKDIQDRKDKFFQQTKDVLAEQRTQQEEQKIIAEEARLIDIVGVIDSGITDPVEIFKQMEGAASLSEISDILKSLQEGEPKGFTLGKGGIRYEFNSETGKFEAVAFGRTDSDEDDTNSGTFPTHELNPSDRQRRKLLKIDIDDNSIREFNSLLETGLTPRDIVNDEQFKDVLTVDQRELLIKYSDEI